MNIKIKKKQSDTSLIYKRKRGSGKGEQNRASEASLGSTKVQSSTRDVQDQQWQKRNNKNENEMK